MTYRQKTICKIKGRIVQGRLDARPCRKVFLRDAWYHLYRVTYKFNNERHQSIYHRYNWTSERTRHRVYVAQEIGGPRCWLHYGGMTEPGTGPRTRMADSLGWWNRGGK